MDGGQVTTLQRVVFHCLITGSFFIGLAWGWYSRGKVERVIREQDENVKKGE